MTSASPADDPQQQLNRVAQEFERFLLKGLRPQIEQYLRRVDSVYRGLLLERILPLEIEWCSRQGITLIPLQFYHRFPEYHSEINKVLTNGSQSAETNTWDPQRALPVLQSSPQKAEQRPIPVDSPEQQQPLIPLVPASQQPPPPPVLAAIIPAATRRTDGKRLGKFRILETLGSGGFGTVYKAEDEVVGRIVALKVPHRLDDELRRRFATEVRAAAKLDHPGIVKVFESELLGEELYVAMQFIDGRDLAHVIKEQRPSLKQLIRWIRDAARALAHAHQRGVIHRDIKPGNLLISQQGQVFVSDFGLARRVEDNSSLTSTGNILGTPRYMSPEQAAGLNKSVNSASDQYGLGAILYEVLTGRPLHVGKMPQLLTQIVQDIPPLPKEINPQIPDPLQAICIKATAKNAIHRFAELDEFANELDRWLNDQPVSVQMNQSPGWWTRLRHNRVLGMFGTALILILASILAIVFMSGLSILRT